jgi:hypothetical protein
MHDHSTPNRRITRTGYVLRYRPDHPHAQSKGHVFEHRLVMEGILGRLLDPEEVVHHLDGNGLNNDPANLELTTQSAHMRDHHEGRMAAATRTRWALANARAGTHPACIECGGTSARILAAGRCARCLGRQSRVSARR